VLDFVRFIALGIGLVRAIRSRSALGVACGTALAYAFGLTLSAVMGAILANGVTGEYGLALVFLGSSIASVTGNAHLPGSVWMAAHPVPRHLVFAALALAPTADAWRHSSKLSPVSQEARRWDALGTPFLLLAMIELSLGVLAALMIWAARET
jgi:hypothetical protein